MKKRSSIIIAFLVIIFAASFMLSGCDNGDYDFSRPQVSSDVSSQSLGRIIDPGSEIRGVWIASTYNIDYPSNPDLSYDQLKSEIDAILSTCSANKLNTIFFQVRPACDALYRSSIFPVSRALSSTGELVFDPLEYLIEEGHRNNIFIYAWINPLRVSLGAAEISSLPDTSPAKLHPDWVVNYNGRLYFNAGIPEVRKLVSDGVAEVVKNYDVDGVVFDDYFYPYPAYDAAGSLIEFDDSKEYSEYGQAFEDISDWRRDNINRMVELCYDAVHNADRECVFGISPFGVWQNDNGKNDGSKTRNFEAYHSLYCDSLAWIEGGYIDFICPQIYWQMASATSPYGVIIDWWNRKLDGSDVYLLTANAAYRYEEDAWEDPHGELSGQIEYSRSRKYYRGSVYYGYSVIKRNVLGASDEIMTVNEHEIVYSEIVSNGLDIKILFPAEGYETTEETIVIKGVSDPFYPLTINGTKVGRTKTGEFEAEVSLTTGLNNFVLKENGKEYNLNIIRKP